MAGCNRIGKGKSNGMDGWNDHDGHRHRRNRGQPDSAGRIDSGVCEAEEADAGRVGGKIGKFGLSEWLFQGISQQCKLH